MKLVGYGLLLAGLKPFTLLCVGVSYQIAVTSCQPHCARANLHGVMLHRPFTRSDGFLEVVLHNVDFRGADLSNANLQSVYLAKSDFRFANLQSANLIDADLAWVCMQTTQLQHADLQYANMYDADLRYADLSGANLAHAAIVASDVSHANLTGANLTDLRYDRETRWPLGFDPKAAGAIASIQSGDGPSTDICTRR